MRRIDQFVVFINRQAVIWMMGLMAVLVFTNVLMRYFLGDSILWGEEASRYLMIWATFLGSGILFRQGAHNAVDNLQDVLPRTAGMVLRGLIVAILVAFFVSMIYIGTAYVLFQWNQTTPVLRIPFGLVYAALPVGFVLMSYHLMIVAGTWVFNKRFDKSSFEQIFGD